jgi:hypothetical protein
MQNGHGISDTHTNGKLGCLCAFLIAEEDIEVMAVVHVKGQSAFTVLQMGDSGSDVGRSFGNPGRHKVLEKGIVKGFG